jgi:NAD(P)-dependent dehydrogenase (short-subunit alcohol dehydrogenase family)
VSEHRSRPPLSQRRAFVTGGASGIGAATARLLAGEGYDVTVADLQDDLGEQVAEAVGGRFVHFDVADAAGWSGVLDGVDLVHLNAGVATGERDLAKVSDEQYRRLMSTNLDGVVFGAREAARAMAGRGGAIVATASVAGLLGFAPDPVYTAAKHAVVGLVRALGPALAPEGITVNAVCPGIVETGLIPPEMVGRLREAGVEVLDPATVAATVWAAATSGRTGECWTVLAGAEPRPFAFGVVDIPGRSDN